MENIMLIQPNNQKAVELLRKLEELNLIKVIKENVVTKESNMSSKYRGIISREEGQKLNSHIQQMRSEWSNT